jgi:antagonist of KipI
MIRVIECGLLSTIQDKGRFGWQKFGVIVSGAMDQEAMCIAN